jgi:hypothetical protein
MNWFKLFSGKLFDDAIKLLSKANIDNGKWSLGGGTVLMSLYEHRRSNDIDIFFKDTSFLPKVSPRLNNALHGREVFYNEKSSFIKINMSYGDIDFIISSQLTNCPNSNTIFDGNIYFAQHPVEIIAKKVFHRADVFTLRDFYDFSVVAKYEKRAMINNKEVFIGKVNDLNKRIDTLLKETISEKVLFASILPYDEKTDMKKFDIMEHVMNVKSLIEELLQMETTAKSKSKERER